MSVDIKQNVSPLKQRQSSRGGKSAGRATATSGRRGGFAKSSGKRGAGGRNVGGYNVNTSFVTPPAWKKPPSGGTITPVKPYKIDSKGKVAMREPGNTTTTNIYNYGDKSINQTAGGPGQRYVKGKDAVYGKREGKLPSYRKAWDNTDQWKTMEDGSKKGTGKHNKGAIYKDFESFEKAAIDYNKKHGKGKAEDEKYLISEATKGYWENIPASNVTQNANIGGMPFTMKGNPMYRNFGIGGKPKK